MNKFITASLTTTTVLLAGILLFSADTEVENTIYRGNKPRKKKTAEERAFFSQQRVQYEYDMLKDGGTGLFPIGIQDRELAVARRIPEREQEQSGWLSPFADNTYQAAGPANFGGRTRAVAFDVRFGTGSNNVIIAGAVSGGIFRSTNGGATWTNVTPENEIHNVTAIAQDPRATKQNIWYAGGGEPLGNSASPSAGGAFYLGNGLFKSVDNGATWQRIANTFQGSLEVFDAPFDIVHKIVVNPVNGHVYVAGHRRLLRSTDEGVSFQEVFAGTQPASADNGQMDVTITSTGRIYLAVNGGFADQNLRGLWFSQTGNANSWTRFAGGQTLNQDSLTGWRANSYNGATPTTSLKRIILALAPSNNNILYAMYENGLSQEGSSGSPEADLFKFDFSNSTFTNLSANMPNFPGQRDGIDPLALQGGYNMLLAVKPDNPNVVFVGGTNLYRSTNGFANTSATSWIGGYKYWGASATTFSIENYDNHHPDVHSLIFDPTNPNRALCATDGGMHITDNIMGAATETLPVTWQMVTNYQSTQYYHVGAEHRATGTQVNNFIGGMQDNGVYFRNGNNNDHVQAGSGDGGAAAIGKFLSFSDYTLFVTSQLGSLARLTPSAANSIEPSTGLTANPNGGEGEFVTYFSLDNDNPENLYYANYNRIFRTTTATTVSATSGWTELTGVATQTNAADPSGDDIGIRAIKLSHGPYTTSSTMYIGTTEGKVFRLNDPRNAAPAAQPVEITPPAISNFINNLVRVNVGGIAVNPNNDNEIMVVYTNYQVTVGGNVQREFNIWTTGNAKSANPTWTLAEGNLTLPSIRSCAIVTRKDATGAEFTDYYVGTSVGLYSAISIRDSIAANKAIVWKREGGRTLNYAVVTSLAYRPQDNLLLVGTHGNGMYFTTIQQPNFKPNVGTGVNDPVRNDKNFIRFSYPTITSNELEYRIGNMFEVKELVVQVYNLNGQLLLKRTGGYQNGKVDVSRLSRGTYILTITSNDYKHQFVKKFLKN